MQTRRWWVSSLILKDTNSNKSFLLFHNVDEFPKRWMAYRNMQSETAMSFFNCIIGSW